MCNLESDRRCQNFLMCTEYTVIMEYSHASEIFHFGGSGKASGDWNFFDALQLYNVCRFWICLMILDLY